MVTVFKHPLVSRGVLPLGEGKQIGYHFARFAGIHGRLHFVGMLANTWWPFSHTNSDNSVLALIYKSLMIKDVEHFPISLFRTLMQSGATWQWRYILKKCNTKPFLSVFKRTHTNRDHVLWLILRNHCHVGSHWSVIWCMNRNFSKVSVQVFFFIIRLLVFLLLTVRASFYILATSL